MDEEESLFVARQQSYSLQQFLDDLYSVWLDAASKEIRARCLDLHRQEDESMLRAFGMQSALLNRMKEWLNVADVHMQQSRLAHRDMETHLEYAQREMDAAEQERIEAMKSVKEAENRLPRVLELIQFANKAGHSY
jgi:hypothetical protein